MPHNDLVARAIVGAVLGGTAALCVWLWKKFKSKSEVGSNREAVQEVVSQPHKANKSVISDDISTDQNESPIVNDEKPLAFNEHQEKEGIETTQPYPNKPKSFKLLLWGSFLIGVLLASVLIVLSGRGPEGARTKLAEMNIPFNERVFFERVDAGDVVVVELFLDAGVSPNLKDEGNYTPLMRAAQRGHNSIVKILLGHGAEVNLTQPGITALDIAEVRERQEIVKILKRAGALTGMELLDRQYPLTLLERITQPEERIARPKNRTPEKALGQQILTHSPDVPLPPDFYEVINGPRTMEERENDRLFDVLMEKRKREEKMK